ncbi:aspartyl/asparaginyl beta-hydroxylase isoform X8 [Oryzias melastigma]|uniref:aspartyl/asparaginyl beta-hydroxylase isoform X8 n=1 Tax=Oryzias melastigma TaxID=30732 RepID=UPI000CF7B405|nr:aspartyl/asparaginyl beta-hydroxylase isoform X8 [Oryzias melastigma]
MQRYHHYENSYSSSPPPAAPVEEIHTEQLLQEEEEEEEYTEEEEEMQPLLRESGGVAEEEVVQKEEAGVQESDREEGKTAPLESKNGQRAEGEGGGAAKYSMFTWLVVLALLGVWSSMAVVYFDIVDYDSVIGKLKAYDSDGDGDFDVEDAKVLLGLKTSKSDSAKEETKPTEKVPESFNQKEEDLPSGAETTPSGEEPAAPGSQDVESDIQAAVPLPPLVEDEFIPDHPQDSAHPYEEEVDAIDSTGVLVEEPQPEKTPEPSGQYQTSSKVTHETVIQSEERAGSHPAATTEVEPSPVEAAGRTEEPVEEKLPVKKKKPKLLNKFDKTIKAEIDAAEKLRKKGKVEEALEAFERLVQQFPQSPRARYGKAQAEDDLAEKLRSNEMLQRAINTFKEASELPDATADLLRAALKRRAERQQFLGRTRGSLVTLQRLVQIFPDDVALKNDLGVAHLLLNDNKGAKQVYEEVLDVAPDNGFAKVHYGFILKAENQIAESIPFLREGLESGEPGTDDGRFYFHLGDALQRVGDDSAYHWYELGHKRGHFASVWQRSLYNVKGLKAQPWWTPKETGYTDLVKALERNWKTIRDEALAVMDQDKGRFLPEDENLREKGEWGQYTLWIQGRKSASSCQGVPKTCSLLERFPEATGCRRGQIKFSVMQPGTHVWPHTGPTNCRLRMHLGLVIPKHGCRIRCTNQTREWEEGKILIFDDSFEHEVWQDADSYRLIFIVDVWHPELTQHQRQTLSPI